MKVILDTNVFISGIFFAGYPNKILKGWSTGKLKLIVSPEILEEYYRVSRRLGKQFPGVAIEPILDLISVEAVVISPPPLRVVVCRDDPSDDIFFACAVASKTKIIISGDKHLLKVSGYRGIAVLTPKVFVEKHLSR